MRVPNAKYFFASVRELAKSSLTIYSNYSGKDAQDNGCRQNFYGWGVSVQGP